jgi:hypothetical protein
MVLVRWFGVMVSARMTASSIGDGAMDLARQGRPMTVRSTSRYGLGLLALLGCLAAGCRADEPDAGEGIATDHQSSLRSAPRSLDLETARRLLRADLDEVVKLVQPAEFTLVDPTGVLEVPVTCDLPDEREGKSYIFQTRQYARHIDEPGEAARLISEHWRGKGYAIQLRTELGYQVLAWTREGGSLSFIVGEPGMTLSGESACVPA